jgi:hypothetical protein
MYTGQCGPAITAHGSLDPKQEIQFQIQIQIQVSKRSSIAQKTQIPLN